jgi:SAM-dependent methyltransferase
VPTIEENYREWNSRHAWQDGAEEWSSDFPGGSKTMWFGLLYPRIHHFLPRETILEIAPGMGRWTQYLKDSCKRLIAIDLSDKCIEGCRTRFSAFPQMQFHVNDGKSLEVVEDHSIDFAFSFDSLVHCEADVLDSYLTQLATKLKPNGIGFFHHSNLKNYVPFFKVFPERLGQYIGCNSCWRARSVNARVFRKLCDKANLTCFSQELVNWDTNGLFLIDCFSMFCRKEFAPTARNVVTKNRDYVKHYHHVMKLAGAALQPPTR